MKLFYIKQVSYSSGIVSNVSIKYGIDSISMSVFTKGDLLTSNVYLASDAQINDIANAIMKGYSGALEVRAFNPSVVEEKKLINSLIIGKHNIYGDEFKDFNTLDSISSVDYSGSNIGVLNIVGFSGKLEKSIVSSSIFAKAILSISNMGLNPAVDTYIETVDNVSFQIQKSAFPGSRVHKMPISIDEINHYDVVFISDHDLASEMHNEYNNFQDVYSELFGITSIYKNSVNMISVPYEKEMIIIDLLKKFPADQKKIFIPQFTKNIVSHKLVIDFISSNFPDHLIILDVCDDDFNEGLNLYNIREDIELDFENLVSLIKNVDFIVSDYMFVVDISHAFSTPALVFNFNNLSRFEYKYYPYVEIINEIDGDLFNSAEAKKSISSFKSFLDKKESKLLVKSENKDESIDSKKNIKIMNFLIKLFSLPLFFLFFFIIISLFIDIN